MSELLKNIKKLTPEQLRAKLDGLLDGYSKEKGITRDELELSIFFEYALSVEFLADYVIKAKEISSRVINGELSKDYPIQKQYNVIQNLRKEILKFYTKNLGIMEALDNAESHLVKLIKEESKSE